MNIFRQSLFLIVICLFTGCEEIFFESEPSNDPISNFESLWSSFDEKYAVFEQREVDWDMLYSQYRPLVSVQSNDEDLFEVVTGMLTHLDDAHVSLMAADRPFWKGKELFRTEAGDDLFQYEVVKGYLDRAPTTFANNYVWGKINGDIGYLWVASLAGPSPTFIDQFIEENQTSKAVIIDLRHNGGGDFTNGELIASRFADEKRLAFEATPKNGPGKYDFGSTYSYFLEPRGDMQFMGQVIVLINEYTVSAGENLALYLMTLPYVTLIGLNTAGAMGERIEKEMPNGWIYSLSAQVITAPDGTSFEGPGIPPDIASVNTSENMESGIDNQLQTAIEFIGPEE